MYRVFIAYIIVFFLECCSILTPINIGSIELKFSIIFELYMFVGLLSNSNKFYSILNIIKELKILFLTLLFSLIVIVFKSYFLQSLILTLRIILILCVSLIPFVYNFNQKKITFSLKIFENILIIYSFYTLLIFLAEGKFGTRFFGPMGDTFAWILAAFVVKYFIEKKYFRFCFFIIYVMVITGSISALILSFISIGLYSIKNINFRKNIKIILFLIVSYFMVLFLFPNLIYNSSLYNRFGIGMGADTSNFENNSNFKLMSIFINFNEIISSFFQVKGFGSTSFLADDVIRNYKELLPNQLALRTASLPSFEIFKFIREFGIIGVFVYLYTYTKIIGRFLKSKNIGSNSFLNYYMGLYLLCSFLIFQPGSLLMILLLFTIVQSIQNTIIHKKVNNLFELS